MFIQYGCGSCHALSDVRTAVGDVGPPLDGIAGRTIIAGHLANRAENMELWIRNPQSVSPGTAMPNLGVSEEDARDMTAFLYTRAK
jgi:cytochrome c2